ncbi:MAG: TVP38/TMEM64 family protein [Proteobacteria bacterium]|nr:TVP38/TMEM64 family protein [Pseudomonadota bacterium]MBU1736797.1 TVP38/TMEM64 family protein [Pseudomonadota bacterium]
MRRALFRRYPIAVALILFGLLLAIYFSDEGLLGRTLDYLRNFKDYSNSLRDDILSHGPRAPFFFILIQVLQVVFAPIPGEASGLLGGYLFGAVPAFFYSSIGLTMGSAAAFGVGRLLRKFLTKRIKDTAFYRKFNHLVSRSDYLIPFVLFLIPGFPKDSLSYLLGMSIMSLPSFLFITAIGRMPGTLMLSLQGAEIYNGNYVKLALLMLLSFLVILPCILYRHRLLLLLEKRAGNQAPSEENR